MLKLNIQEESAGKPFSFQFTVETKHYSRCWNCSYSMYGIIQIGFEIQRQDRRGVLYVRKPFFFSRSQQFLDCIGTVYAQKCGGKVGTTHCNSGRRGLEMLLPQ